ncbi:uncharacterized protein LOC135401155 isoform X2 [Ornithodoros turicata]|uniref:uncharacterized protein LOC135401155 isoform X2 n=1 Tax=Ornithodoros turicata TaxID=34597 RepID=UPI003138A1A5
MHTISPSPEGGASKGGRVIEEDEAKEEARQPAMAMSYPSRSFQLNHTVRDPASMNKAVSILPPQMRSSGSMFPRSRIGSLERRVPPEDAGVMQYLIILVIIFVTMFGVGVGVYFSFLQSGHQEFTATAAAIGRSTCDVVEPYRLENGALICSVNGSVSMRYPFDYCSHIVFLSATIDSQGSIQIPPEKVGQFTIFGVVNNAVRKVVKLLSIKYEDMKHLSPEKFYDIVDEFFRKQPFLDGVDIRYVPVPKPEAQAPVSNYLNTTRELLERNQKMLHVTFGTATNLGFDLATAPHIASVRVYAELNAENMSLPANRLRTLNQSILELSRIQAPSGRALCPAVSLAIYRYDSLKQVGRNILNGEKVAYCTVRTPLRRKQIIDNSDLFTYETDGHRTFLYESGSQLEEKVKLLKALPSPACLMVDDAAYDDTTCECTGKRFFLLASVRRALRELENSH